MLTFRLLVVIAHLLLLFFLRLHRPYPSSRLDHLLRSGTPRCSRRHIRRALQLIISSAQFAQHVRFDVIDDAFEPVAVLEVHRQAAKLDVHLRPRLGQWSGWRVLHVMLRQLELDSGEVGACGERFNQVKVVEFPELDNFILIDRQHEPLIVHNVLVDYLGQAPDPDHLLVLH